MTYHEMYLGMSKDGRMVLTKQGAGRVDDLRNEAIDRENEARAVEHQLGEVDGQLGNVEYTTSSGLKVKPKRL